MHPRFLKFAVCLLASLPSWKVAISPAAADADRRPKRIVSTNLCTDQLLLNLVGPERIASLTYLSWKDGATPPELLRLLKGIKQNHGLAEEVMMLEPDLVVSGHYSARFTTALFQRMGRKVVLFDPETSFDDMRANIRKMGGAVGEQKRADDLIEKFDRELAALQSQIPKGERPVFAEIGVNYFVAGKDTLYTKVVNAGGFRTLGEVVGFSGYRVIPLEQLIQYHPDLISTSTQYDKPPALTTQSLHHPLLRKMALQAPILNIPARYAVCANPETLKAVRMLIEARKKIDARTAVVGRQILP